MVAALRKAPRVAPCRRGRVIRRPLPHRIRVTSAETAATVPRILTLRANESGSAAGGPRSRIPRAEAATTTQAKRISRKS